MAKIKYYSKLIFGEREKIESDRYFMSITCFIGSIFLIILCIFHLTMELKPEPVFIAGGSSVLFFFMYYLFRFTKCLFIPKLLVTILGIILLDLTWYSKFLSLGPVLFFIFAFGALILWVWDAKWLLFMLVFYFVNIGFLFFIEYTSNNFSFEYDSLQRRAIDIYVSFLLYFSLLILILSQIKKDFQIQKEKAIKSDKLKSAFLANMSHEIRTPLNAIVGFSSLLETNPDQEKRDNYIKIIQGSSDNLLKLIEEIIDLSKIEAGYLQLDNSNFSLNNLFTELKHTHELDLKKRGKTNVLLQCKIPETDVHIYSDRLRLSQIISNLISNSAKFTTKGEISYSFEKKGKEIIFTISDTGAGIAKEDQSKIFNRFTKLKHEGLNIDGFGIGLSIVEKLIELFNGKIWLDSKIGEGTNFYFSIPYIKPQKEILPAEKTQNPIKQRASTKSILIAEDDELSSLLLREILSSFNFDIHQVSNGIDAVEFMKQNPNTKLVFMDIKMPKSDGYFATTEIRKLNSKVIIIAQSANALTEDREKALLAGCDNYITKPFESKKKEKC